MKKTWTKEEACRKVLDMLVSERNKAPHCVICDKVLYQYEKNIYGLLYLLEVRDRKITNDIYPNIIHYVYENYPFKNDGSLHRHHVNYKLNIQIPVCGTCHNKIHNRKKDPVYAIWSPVDKKGRKNKNIFKTNLFKPFDVEKK